MLKHALLLCALLLPFSASAASVHFGDYFLKGAQNVPDDIYIAGETALFAGSVAGDAFAISRTIFNQGEISGDIFFVGEEMQVKGKILDDARLLGAVITVGGTISDDVVAIGSKVVIEPDARIEGSLYVIGDKVEIHGAVLGDATIFSNRLLLTGTVGGGLELWGRAVFEKTARIGGDFIQHAGGKAAAPVNVTIGGETILDKTERGGAAFPSSFFGGFFSLKVLMMLALGFALFFFVRERTEEVLLDALPNYWVRVLRGFLITILLPVASLLLFLSVVGIPIALVLAALFLALMLISFACAGILLGALLEQFFFKRSAFPLSYRPVLLGIICLSAISVIPFIGPIIYGILSLAAAGSLGTVFFRKLRARI